MAQQAADSSAVLGDLSARVRLELPPGWAHRRTASYRSADQRVRVDIIDEARPEGISLPSLAAERGRLAAAERGGSVVEEATEGIALNGRGVVLQTIEHPDPVAEPMRVRLAHHVDRDRLTTVAVTCSASDLEARRQADEVLSSMEPSGASVARGIPDVTGRGGNAQPGGVVGTFSHEELAAAAAVAGIRALPLIGPVSSTAVSTALRSLLARGVVERGPDGVLDLDEGLVKALRASTVPDALLTIETGSNLDRSRTVLHVQGDLVLVARPVDTAVLTLEWRAVTDLAAVAQDALPEIGGAALAGDDVPSVVSLLDLDQVRAGSTPASPAAAALGDPSEVLRIRGLAHHPDQVTGRELLVVDGAEHGAWLVEPTPAGVSAPGVTCAPVDALGVRAALDELLVEMRGGVR